MFINLPHNYACETFKRNDLVLTNETLTIMNEIRSKLESLNYKAVIISIIK